MAPSSNLEISPSSLETRGHSFAEDRDTLYVINRGGNISSQPVEVIIILRPTVTQSGDTLFASEGGASYQWFFNGSPLEGAIESFYVKQEVDEGLYNVRIITAEGCSATSSKFGMVTGIATNDDASIQFYPNPTSGLVAIKATPNMGDIAVNVINPSGQMLWQGNFRASSLATVQFIDISHLKAGVYIIQAYSNRFNEIQRLIKR